jgi:hypothetical protein
LIVPLKWTARGMAVTQSNHFVAGYITRFLRALKVVEESVTSRFQRI